MDLPQLFCAHSVGVDYRYEMDDEGTLVPIKTASNVPYYHTDPSRLLKFLPRGRTVIVNDETWQTSVDDTDVMLGAGLFRTTYSGTTVLKGFVQHHAHKYSLIQSSGSFLPGDKEKLFGVTMELADSSSLNATLLWDEDNNIIPWARMEITYAITTTDKERKVFDRQS